MIKIEKVEVVGMEAAIRGMRNPMNSWKNSDSMYMCRTALPEKLDQSWCVGCGNKINSHERYVVGQNDYDLMQRLAIGGSVHAKYRRMITVYMDITAPLYWWKEFDTYKVGTVCNSCSTMHKIHDKEFTSEDFSCEHLFRDGHDCIVPFDILKITLQVLNAARTLFITTGDKQYWWQMIQLLPSSYNQKRTVMLNYEVLANIYQYRKNHKLDEWCAFCEWIKTLPYSELITCNAESEAE